MIYYDIDINKYPFKKFAEAMKEQEIKIDQFARISDMDVSWQGGKNLYISRSIIPTIFIRMKINDGQEPYFILEVCFSQERYCYQKFDTPIAAIDYLNNAINQSRTYQQIIDNIWAKYGL